LMLKECIVDTLKGGYCGGVSVAPLIGFHSAWLFNVSFREAVSSGELMAELQVRAAKLYGVHAVFTYMDLTFEPEALGAGVIWRDVPAIGEPAPLERALEIVDIGDEYLSRGRIPVFLRAVKSLSERATDLLTCAYVSGPLTLTAETFGVKRVIKLVRANPSLLKELIERTNRLTKLLASELVASGAECIMVLEPVGALISPRSFRQLLLPSLKDLINSVKSRGALSILHICGNANHLVELMAECGPHALSIDKFVDVADALRRAPNVAIMGNVGTGEVYALSPNEVYELGCGAVAKSKGRRFVLSTGCEVPPYTPPENIKALVKAAKCAPG